MNGLSQLWSTEKSPMSIKFTVWNPQNRLRENIELLVIREERVATINAVQENKGGGRIREEGGMGTEKGRMG